MAIAIIHIHYELVRHSRYTLNLPRVLTASGRTERPETPGDSLSLSETATTVTLQCIKRSFKATRVFIIKNYSSQLFSIRRTLHGTKRREIRKPQLFKSTYVSEGGQILIFGCNSYLLLRSIFSQPGILGVYEIGAICKSVYRSIDRVVITPARRSPHCPFWNDALTR